jgi:hypothetical protein
MTLEKTGDGRRGVHSLVMLRYREDIGRKTGSLRRPLVSHVTGRPRRHTAAWLRSLIPMLLPIEMREPEITSDGCGRR